MFVCVHLYAWVRACMCVCECEWCMNVVVCVVRWKLQGNKRALRTYDHYQLYFRTPLLEQLPSPPPSILGTQFAGNSHALSFVLVFLSLCYAIRFSILNKFNFDFTIILPLWFHSFFFCFLFSPFSFVAFNKLLFHTFFSFFLFISSTRSNFLLSN